MIKETDNPADCEVRSVIRFLNAQTVRATDIHRQLTAVHGEGVMNDSNVMKWCQMFNAGRTNVHTKSDLGTRAVESESEEILGGVGVGKNVPTPTPNSI
jgi:hypothetical protein